MPLSFNISAKNGMIQREKISKTVSEYGIAHRKTSLRTLFKPAGKVKDQSERHEKPSRKRKWNWNKDYIVVKMN